MDALKLVLRLVCLLPLVTGANDLAQGVRALGPAGAVIPARVAADPVLNSQFKFFGAVWFGWGLTLWRASADPRADAGLLRLLMGILFLSGLGRASAALQLGHPGRLSTGAMVLELVGAPLLLLWHRVALRGDDRR